MLLYWPVTSGTYVHMLAKTPPSASPNHGRAQNGRAQNGRAQNGRAQNGYGKELDCLYARMTAIDALIHSLEAYNRFGPKASSDSKLKTA
jgi:hypothetical protein